MEALAIVTALSGLQAFFFAFQVGRQRVAHGVPAPAMSGHDDFMKAYRAHQNTVEQLVIFLPGLWLFGYYVSPMIGAGLGLVFVIGRFVYWNGYMKSPKNRGPGFLISAGAMIALVLGGLIGAVVRWAGSGTV